MEVDELTVKLVAATPLKDTALALVKLVPVSSVGRRCVGSTLMPSGKS